MAILGLFLTQSMQEMLSSVLWSGLALLSSGALVFNSDFWEGEMTCDADANI